MILDEILTAHKVQRIKADSFKHEEKVALRARTDCQTVFCARAFRALQ